MENIKNDTDILKKYLLDYIRLLELEIKSLKKWWYETAYQEKTILNIKNKYLWLK